MDLIRALIPSNLSLDEYLSQVTTDSINEMFNDLLQSRQVEKYGKTLLEQSILLNKYGFKNDTIVNQNRFVGMQIRIPAITGLQMFINQIGFQFTDVNSFDLYVFHSSSSLPIATIPVTTVAGSAWKWIPTDLELNSFQNLDFQGGVFVVGYYQDDLSAQAINNTGFNWDRGACKPCGNKYANTWKAIKNHYQVYPLYVPFGSFTFGEMFDLDDAIYSNNQSWGLNFKFSVRCDLTDFFIQNKFAFKNLLAYKVVHKIMNMMKFSQQVNYVEENIKNMIIRDLEGDVHTKMLNIISMYNKELKSVKFNIEAINSKCLGCSTRYEPEYSVS